MRKGRDGEWKKWKKNGKWKKKNNGENSGPLTSLQVDRLTATDCNAAALAKRKGTSRAWSATLEFQVEWAKSKD